MPDETKVGSKSYVVFLNKYVFLSLFLIIAMLDANITLVNHKHKNLNITYLVLLYIKKKGCPAYLHCFFY